MKIAVVGAGNVGTALAVLLQNAGYTITGIASRTAASASRAGHRLGVPHGTDPLPFTAGADFVFLTTPDRAIAGVCAQIAAGGGFAPGSIVAHTSGAHDSRLLAPAAAAGARVLSFHPLQTFANPDAGIMNLPGSFITIEGHPEALPVARKLVEDLSCRLLEIPTSAKPLYHAAACIACNYFTTLVFTALRVMETAGIDSRQGLQALRPLLEGTLNNILRVGPVRSLTGPIARGDHETVRSHLEAMARQIPGVIPLYSTLGLATAEIAMARGTLGPVEREKIDQILGGNYDEQKSNYPGA